ncbi:GNAT family N-acetyltransferase [Microbacterium hominis]|uniref:GNAT family N-acetyltransferase n=1 Tax=Microbacterium hominis TaxID=162426 RepID=UPI001E42F286|nr:GNAT family N-acetyltransferase [Microbacterium hominis]
MIGSHDEYVISSVAEWAIRDAEAADVTSICAFGDAYIRQHYAPLIGVEAADLQVLNWWSESQIHLAVTGGLMVVAEAVGGIVGVAQRGRDASDHVLYKLYIAPVYRGRGLGPALIEAVIQRLPSNGARLCVEHFAGNERAGAFYEREGFFVERIERSGADSARDVVWRVRDL